LNQSPRKYAEYAISWGSVGAIQAALYHKELF